MQQHYTIQKIREHPELVLTAARWFHEKWDIPEEAYLESMNACLSSSAPVPQWYVAMDDGCILGGLGVIKNDFHDRKDLSPNVCAVYVEEAVRNQGIAGDLLHSVCSDMLDMGISVLYLVTDHTGFYERYGWQFLCMAQGDGEDHLTRMYVHVSK